MRHQYGISTLVSPTSFGRENSGSECQLFSQANFVLSLWIINEFENYKSNPINMDTDAHREIVQVESALKNYQLDHRFPF